MKRSKISLHGHRRFHPPSPDDTPRDLFTEGGRAYSSPRFRRVGNGSELLIFVAACSLHATTPSRAVGFGIKVSSEDIASEYLEQPQPQSRNRAELHAAVRALRSAQTWGLVEFNSLILACSSDYLVNGVYDRVGKGRRWVQRCKAQWKPDKHEDLWAMLMRELEDCDKKDISVQFWKIPEAVNEASSAAQRSALSSMAEMNHISPTAAEAAAIIDKL